MVFLTSPRLTRISLLPLNISLFLPSHDNSYPRMGDELGGDE